MEQSYLDTSKKKQKPQLTPEQLYKKNQKKSKLFKRLSPVVYWVFIGLTIFFASLTIKNSLGNITEILELLDKDTYTRQQIAENYGYLVDKWGEWSVIGTDGSLFEVQFIDIGRALFSGLMKTYLVFTLFSFGVAIIVGKVVLPNLSNYYKDHNQDMVNLATLETQAEVKKIAKKNKEKEWF